MQKPWLSDPVINFINKNTSKNHMVFEWGSGNSTVYFAPRVKKIISIEYNVDWFKKVQRMLATNKITNVDLKFIAPNEGSCNDVLNLNTYASNSKLYKHKIFKTYASIIDNCNIKFNWIMVDGRSRISCLKHAINNIAPSGYIMLDDSERNYYAPGKNLFNNTQWIITSLPGKVSHTTTHFFQKRQ